MTLCLMECVFFSFASPHVNNISYQGPIKSVYGDLLWVVFLRPQGVWNTIWGKSPVHCTVLGNEFISYVIPILKFYCFTSGFLLENLV